MSELETSSPSPPTVLVLDGDWVSALAIVRSLGRRGIRVDVGAAAAHPLASRSRYCRSDFIYPDPMGNAAEFRRSIERRLSEYRYKLVMPVTDRTIVPLMAVRERIERLAPLTMASNEALEKTLSKERTTELAQRLGIPTPNSRVVRTLKEALSDPDELGFPLVLKPDRSKVWTSHGEAQDLSVVYAQDSQELAEKLSVLLPSGPVLVQEKIPGQGVGMGVLASGGEILYLFQYSRLHEVPLSGGASSYRISEPVSKELAAFATALIEALGWDGVAMLEFKRDPESGSVWLIEINGRFWGSLPLPVAAGADFPAYLFDLNVEQRRRFPAAYRTGVRCRSERRELRWLLETLHAVVRGLTNAPTLGRIVVDTLRMVSPLERWDTLSLTDPAPGIAEIRSLAGKVIGRLQDGFARRTLLRRQKVVRRRPGGLASRLRRARHILILCRGNIMRSPFAAALLECADSDGQKEIRSAGLEGWPGKPPHPGAVAEASRRGVDLRTHRAAPLTRELASWADVIFAMEAAHLLDIRRRFPEVADRSFLLSTLAPEVALEIPDPVFEGPEFMGRCFDLIEAAVVPIVAQFVAAGGTAGGYNEPSVGE